jgi:hypothetical protein
MPFGTIVSAAQSYNSVCKFVTSGELYEAVSVIGDTELEAAQLALDSSRIARDPKAQVWAAITHLQTAFTAYRNSHQRLSTGFKKNLSVLGIEIVLRKLRWVSCLMAVCYVYVGEIELAKEAVKCAREAKRQLQESDASLLTILSMLNPAEYKRFFEDTNALMISEGDFRTFCALIEAKRVSRQKAKTPKRKLLKVK